MSSNIQRIGLTRRAQVMLQAMKEEPPLNAKCKDKFLIQSMLIPPEKAAVPLHDLVRCLPRKAFFPFDLFFSQWTTPEGEEPGKIHSQKVKVNYLPPEGHPLDEEDEFPHRMSMMSGVTGVVADDAVSRCP
jgi:vesicle-associated membrane protein-associated protein A